jgi:tripartite-type tricarboxylate transporter receptor subunit TctC
MKPFANIARSLRLAATALCAGLLASAAQAQTWPTKPVRIIVPFAPGGTSDTIGRVVAEQLSETFKQQFIVENKAGGGGLTGSALVARAAPDGHTLVVSGIASHVVVPAINPSVNYDPLKDFTHIALFGGPPAAFVINPTIKASTLKEFEAVARASKTPMSYGSPGAGTHGHLIGEAYLQKAGVKMEHIAYKGGAAAMTDLIAGHIPASSNALTSAAPHIRSGAARPLAITAPGRIAAFPDVPTFAEAGYPDLVATTWFGLSGPPGMPKDIVERLNKEVVRILETPQVKSRLEKDAVVSEPMTSAQFTDFVAAELARWTPIAKASGAQPE